MKKSLQMRHLFLPLGRSWIYASNFYCIINNLRMVIINQVWIFKGWLYWPQTSQWCKNVAKQVFKCVNDFSFYSFLLLWKWKNYKKLRGDIYRYIENLLNLIIIFVNTSHGERHPKLKPDMWTRGRQLIKDHQQWQ